MKKTTRSFDAYKITILFLALIFVYAAVQHGLKLYRVRQEMQKTQQQVEKLEAEKVRLEQEKKNLGDINYVEKIAREEHNMVRQGEIPIFIIEEKDKAKTDKKKAAEK